MESWVSYSFVAYGACGRTICKGCKIRSNYRASQASGEGKWTVEESLDLEVPAPVIAMSLMMRNRSLQEDSMSGKVVAALRNGFGGHAVENKTKE